MVLLTIGSAVASDVLFSVRPAAYSDMLKKEARSKLLQQGFQTSLLKLKGKSIEILVSSYELLTLDDITTITINNSIDNDREHISIKLTPLGNQKISGFVAKYRGYPVAVFLEGKLVSFPLIHSFDANSKFEILPFPDVIDIPGTVSYIRGRVYNEYLKRKYLSGSDVQRATNKKPNQRFKFEFFMLTILYFLIMVFIVIQLILSLPEIVVMLSKKISYNGTEFNYKISSAAFVSFLASSIVGVLFVAKNVNAFTYSMHLFNVCVLIFLEFFLLFKLSRINKPNDSLEALVAGSDSLIEVSLKSEHKKSIMSFLVGFVMFWTYFGPIALLVLMVNLNYSQYFRQQWGLYQGPLVRLLIVLYAVFIVFIVSKLLNQTSFFSEIYLKRINLNRWIKRALIMNVLVIIFISLSVLLKFIPILVGSF